MKKRIMSLLALVLILSLVSVPAYAASDEATTSAQALYQLGLFNGTGKDAQGNPIFDLDRTPTRYEAVTLLVRLLGRTNEAESKEWNTPFTDLNAGWAKPYVGYAYANKLTSGTSGTTYDGGKNATVSQYITFVLRALGYESGTDFEWNKAWELSDELGITSGQYNASTTNFTRGDVVIISFNALSVKMKGKDITLFADLTARGVVKEHNHNYVTKTVPGTGGHYEQVQTGTKWVEDYTIVIEYECSNCHWKSTDREAFYTHIGTLGSLLNAPCPFAGYYTTEKKVSNGGHEEPVYENKWVEDSPTTIRVCSICGQQEP